MPGNEKSYSPLALLHSRLHNEGVLNDVDDELLFELIENPNYDWRTREIAIKSLKSRELLEKVVNGEIKKYADTHQECLIPSQAMSFGAEPTADDFVTVSYDLRIAARETLQKIKNNNNNGGKINA